MYGAQWRKRGYRRLGFNPKECRNQVSMAGDLFGLRTVCVSLAGLREQGLTHSCNFIRLTVFHESHPQFHHGAHPACYLTLECPLLLHVLLHTNSFLVSSEAGESTAHAKSSTPEFDATILSLEVLIPVWNILKQRCEYLILEKAVYLLTGLVLQKDEPFLQALNPFFPSYKLSKIPANHLTQGTNT